MGYYIMAVRAKNDPIVNDFVVWSTFSDAPVARGTRDEVSTWWKSIFGSAGLQSLEINSPFDRADEYGSSEASGVGRWDETISVHGFGILNGGQLDRDKLPAFINAVFARDRSEAEGNGRGHVEVGREVRALVTPFDPAEDPEIDIEVWKIQAEQAIADFEGCYDADPDLA